MSELIMNIEEFLNIIRKRPGMYVKLELSFVFAHLSGFLLSKYCTSGYDDIDKAYIEKFHAWGAEWITNNLDFTEGKDLYDKILEIAKTDEDAVDLFLKLSEKFFDEIHGKCDGISDCEIINSINFIGNNRAEFTFSTDFGGGNILRKYRDNGNRKRDIVLPNDVTMIGGPSFESCKYLESIILPKGIRMIADSAFKDCTRLKYILLPEELQHIGNKVFMSCICLESIALPESVTYIGERAFHDCVSLKEIKIPSGINSIEYRTFGFCMSMTDVTVPNGIENIGISAFEGCTSLTSITIPNSVISIKDNAFRGCENLTILCSPESYAHKYAIDNNMNFILFTNNH